MRYLISSFFLSIMLVSLVGCKSVGAAFPRVYDIPYAYPEDAPEEWKKGWEHGCKSGYSAYGNMYYKTLYKYEQDPVMMRHAYYAKAWLDAFGYCRTYVNRYLAGEPFGGDKTKYELFSSSSLSVGGGDHRSTSLVNQRWGLELDQWYGGIDSPGYGTLGWGANVPCQTDWLGRMPEGCGWMGYGK